MLRTLLCLAALCTPSTALAADLPDLTAEERTWIAADFRDASYAKWYEASFRRDGFMRPFVDRRWRPEPRQYATLVSQARLVYVMSVGFEQTGEARFREAAEKGARFLLDRFKADDDEGWYWRVDGEGRERSRSKRRDAYGRAFAIFALAHAYTATREVAFANEARDLARRLPLWAEIDSHPSALDTSAVLHTLEALLALHEASPDPAVRERAQAVLGFAFVELYDADAHLVPEAIDSGGRPRGPVDIGHQLEWAYLASEAARTGVSSGYVEHGHRLIDHAIRAGYDAADGGVFDEPGARGEKGWWQQAELLRAALRYARHHGRADLWPRIHQTLGFVRANLLDASFGGWFRSAAAAREGGRKGDAWKVGYHVVGLYREALSPPSVRAAHLTIE